MILILAQIYQAECSRKNVEHQQDRRADHKGVYVKGDVSLACQSHNHYGEEHEGEIDYRQEELEEIQRLVSCYQGAICKKIRQRHCF